jgi:hypothetical protein
MLESSDPELPFEIKLTSRGVSAWGRLALLNSDKFIVGIEVPVLAI